MIDNKIIDKELKTLAHYRKLFSIIERSDHSLEYSGEELISYRDAIESGKWDR